MIPVSSLTMQQSLPLRYVVMLRLGLVQRGIQLAADVAD